MAKTNIDDKKDLLLKTALKIAEKRGYLNVTKRELSDITGISVSNVGYHLGPSEQTMTLIIDKAIEIDNYIVIAQALSFNDARVKNISDKLKNKAALSIKNKVITGGLAHLLKSN